MIGTSRTAPHLLRALYNDGFSSTACKDPKVHTIYTNVMILLYDQKIKYSQTFSKRYNDMFSSTACEDLKV